MFTFRHAKQSIALIDEFLDKTDQGILKFKEGVSY